jgi:glyoxylase-like metal-dependent hydrolase (beta-lactamase superfamily II)
VIEQILPNLYKIEVPLPESPLKATNAYLIKGPDRDLIVDTGMNREKCAAPFLSALGELRVDLDRTDFFITHLHADHLGLVARLPREKSKVFFGEVESAIVTSIARQGPVRVNALRRFYLANGFPEEELRRAEQRHPGFRYGPGRNIDFSPMKEGDILQVGDYSLRGVSTPGHSPGHMCLYDAEKKILFAGDHLLCDITPNITRWPELENSLGAYLESLQKTYLLDVELVLPGHRSLFTDHRGRIKRLQEHHQGRLAESLSALEDRPGTAWDVAPHITWDIRFKSWKLFPPVQKWFAVGEVIAHLNYLEAQGTLERRKEHTNIVYKRC